MQKTVKNICVILPVVISESQSESEDDLGLSSHRCRNNRRKLGNGATKNKPQQKQKHAKVKADKRKSSKAPLLEPFNWDDLFPKYNTENEATYPAGATHSQSQNRRTSRDHLLSRPVINNYHGNRYGVFDKRKNTSSRSSYGCYTNYGRRMSNDPESVQDVDMNRNRPNRNELRCRGDMSRQPTNRGASRRSGPSNHSNPGASTDNRRLTPRNHSNTYEKATHVNLQTSDVTNSCVQRNNELTAALRYTVNLPPLNGVTTTTNQVNNDHYSNQVNLDNLLYTSTFQLTSSCSSLASSYQQQCFCDSSLHISLRCRQCQANWLADPAWRSRRSLLAPSSSDSLESERALSIDSKMWHSPTPPPAYDEALNAPERIHRIDFNNEVSFFLYDPQF